MSIGEPRSPLSLPTSSPVKLHLAPLTGQRHLAERTRGGDAPSWPLFAGVYSFPFYDSSLKAWLWLSLGGLLVGFLALQALARAPF